jgi:hypothetical protein
MMNVKPFLLILAIASFCQPVIAETYELSVTRKGGNTYKVDGKNIIIQTRYCYVYAYSENSILKSNGYGGDLIFIDSKDKCDVKAVFGTADQKEGKYEVTVTREADDWYEVFGTSTYIKTSACLSLALGEDAVLSLTGGNFGNLIFKDGTNCMVEGLYSKLRL